MNLNIHIFFDELFDFSPSLSATESLALNIRGVRLASGADTLDSSYLYLLTEHEVVPSALGCSNQHIVFLGTSLEQLPPSWNVIQIDPEHTASELFLRLQEIFEKYTLWQEEVLKITLASNDLQVAIDKVSSVLVNPIALIDNSQTLVLKGGRMPKDIGGSIWKELTEKGFARLEYLTKEQQQRLNQQLKESEEPFFLEQVPPYLDSRHLIAPLHNEGKPFGEFGMSDLNGPITPGQVSLVKIIQGLMKHLLLSDLGNQHLGDQIGYHTDLILQGYLVERGALAYALSLRNWKLSDTFQAVFLHAGSIETPDDRLQNIHAMRVQSIFPTSYAFAYDDGVLALLHCAEEHLDSPSGRAELETLCADLNIYGGISMKHTGFLQIREAYLQARSALFCGDSSPKQRLMFFEEHYVSCLSKSLENPEELSSLCHPIVLRQWLREGSKGRVLVETLCHYLLEGRNTNATARAMNLHRNTVIYRLEQLKDLLGDDLNSTDANTQLILLFSCLLVDRIKTTRRVS